MINETNFPQCLDSICSYTSEGKAGDLHSEPPPVLKPQNIKHTSPVSCSLS